MFCENCGKELPDDAKFCRYCGYELKGGNIGNDAEQEQPENKEFSANQYASFTSKQKASRKKRRRWIIFLVICILLAIAIIYTIIATHLSNPKGTVEKYFDKYLISESDPESFWDEFVSDRSKRIEVVDKNTFVDYMTDQMESDGITLISYNAKSSTKVDDNIYEIDGTLTYKDSRGQLTKDINSYVERTGLRYKLILYGATENESFYTDPEEDNLTWISSDIYSCLDGSAIVRSEFCNNASYSFYFNTSQVDAMLANGESRSSIYSDYVNVNLGQTRVFYSAFSDVGADIIQFIVNDMACYYNGSEFTNYMDYTLSLTREDNEEDSIALAALEAAEKAESEAEEEQEELYEQDDEYEEAEPTHYAIGETWTVDDNWDFTIDGVKVVDYPSDTGQLIQIDYHYTNLGYGNDTNGLIFRLDDDTVVDSNGVVASNYDDMALIGYEAERIYPHQVTVGGTFDANSFFMINSKDVNSAELTMKRKIGDDDITVVFDLNW